AGSTRALCAARQSSTCSDAPVCSDAQACSDGRVRSGSATAGQARSAPSPTHDGSWRPSCTGFVVGFRKSLGFLETAHGRVMLHAGADDEEGFAFDRAHANAVRRVALTAFCLVARTNRVPPMNTPMGQRRRLPPPH